VAESENKLGRPTKYLPEYCDMIIEHCSEGYSFDSFAGKIGINQDTLYNWCKLFPEFSVAKSTALEKARLFWEKQGIDGLYSITEYDEKTGRPTKSKSLSSSVWIYNMKNRFSKEWSDRVPEQKDSNTTVNIAFDPNKITKKKK